MQHMVSFSVFTSSEETREALLNWSKHDDEAERFCVVDGKCSIKLLNERFTSTFLHLLHVFVLDQDVVKKCGLFPRRGVTRLPVCGPAAEPRALHGLQRTRGLADLEQHL